MRLTNKSTWGKTCLAISSATFLAGMGFAAQAEQMCIPYTSDGSVVASMEIAKSDLQNNAKLALGKYLDAAKDPEKNVLQTLTKLDSSNIHVQNQLKQTPDLFSGYGGIRSFEIDKSFAWGNYVLFYAEYDHANGTASLLESVLCTNLCQVSNFMERPKIAEDLASRFFQQLRVSAKNVYACDSPGKETAIVSPSLTLNKGHPLRFAYNSSFGQQAISSISALNWGAKGKKDEPSECENVLKKTFVGRTENPDLAPIDKEDVNTFISACAVNMKLLSAVPILDLSSSQREFYSPGSFAQMFADASDLKIVTQIKNGNRDIVVVELNNGGKKLVMLPFIKKGTHRLIDWSQYGTAVGEALTTYPFANFYKKKFKS